MNPLFSLLPLVGEKMVYTKRYFIEITTLNQMSDDLVYLSLDKNIKDSFITIYKIESEYTYRGVKHE